VPIPSWFRTSALVPAASFAIAAPAQAFSANKPAFGFGTAGYGDDQGVANDITVSEPFGFGKVRFHDGLSNASPMTASWQCNVVNAVTSECPLDDVGQVDVFPSAGDDSVSIDTSVSQPAFALAGYGNDTVYGASEDDTLAENWGDDSVYGGYGDDILTDSAKFFILFFIPPDVDGWGGGNDTVAGGPGNDWLDGGELPLGTGAGSDVIDGGSGTDTVV
jgi:hypothetical protein